MSHKRTRTNTFLKFLENNNFTCAIVIKVFKSELGACYQLHFLPILQLSAPNFWTLR